MKGEAKEVRVTLDKDDDGCVANKQREKASKPVSSQKRIVDGGREVKFGELLCRCNYTLKVEHNNYNFSDGGRRAHFKPKPDEVVVFTSEHRPEPAPITTFPCNRSPRSKPIELDIPQPGWLTTDSVCREEGKKYYDDYELKSDIAGYEVEVKLQSDIPNSLILDVLQDGVPINHDPITEAKDSYAWSCELENHRSYILRVSNKEPSVAANLKYQLSVSRRGLTQAGFDNQIEHIQSDLGLVGSPGSTPMIFNLLYQQIAIFNNGNATEKEDANRRLREVTTRLEKLEPVTETAKYDQSLSYYTLLTLAYRYYKKDFIKAREREIKAVDSGAVARFIVNFSKKEKFTNRDPYWLIIRNHNISIEKLEKETRDDLSGGKYSPVEKITPKSSGVILEIQLSKKDKKDKKDPYYIAPISNDKNEASTIESLLNKYAK